MGRRRKTFPNYASPPRLYSIAAETILNYLTKICSRFSINDFKKVQAWMDVFLRQLPCAVQEHIMKEAETFLDCPQKVMTLLSIWISVLKKPFSQSSITTPRYLCSSKVGRLIVLKHLLQSNSNDFSTQCLALNMYSFYQHPNFNRINTDLRDYESSQGIVVGDASILLDNDEHFLLCRTIETYQNVETLVLPTVCDNAAIFVIATNCSRLKMLDVSFSTNVTDVGISASFDNDLCVVNNLEQIFLEGTNITKASILLLLRNQIKLEVVESAHLGNALKNLAKNFVEENAMELSLRKLSMSSNHIERNSTPYNLLHLSELCPHVEDVILPSIHRELQLIELAKLSNLCHLYLGEISLTLLASTLERTGPNLRSLRYTNFTEFVDIDFVLSSCPNLETIGISAGCLVYSTQGISIWPNLKCIYLNIHALIGKPIWERLFLNCIGLEFLDMTPGDGMTDSAIQEVCYRCPNALTQIKTFVVRGRHCAGDVLLTDKTIDILSSRSKQLNVIGNCITWSMPANSQYGEFVCLKY